MKKLKLISLVFLIGIFSCTLPMETIEPKINGVKIDKKFQNITSLSVDEDNNLYIIENNILKKLDGKTNELTIIAGKEEPDEFPDDAKVDGDINTAKFGTISKPFFVKKENAIYFLDSFMLTKKEIERKKKEKNNYYWSDYESVYRKIVNNKVQTVSDKSLHFNLSGDKYAHLQEEPESFRIVPFKPILEYGFNNNTPPILNDGSAGGFIIDNTGFIYIFHSKQTFNSEYEPAGEKTISIVRNNKWEKLISTIAYSIYCFLDKNDNLYILEARERTNIENKLMFIIGYNILLHKIPKKDILNSTGLINLKNNKYYIGNLDREINYDNNEEICSSHDGRYIYSLNKISIDSKEKLMYSSSIYKTKIGVN